MKCSMCEDTGMVIYETELLPGIYGDVMSGCMLCKKRGFKSIAEILDEDRKKLD